jgi:hypothetical protein
VIGVAGDASGSVPTRPGPAAARERARLLRVQQQRTQARNRLLFRVITPVVAVVAVVVALVLVKLNTHHHPPAQSGATGLASASVVHKLSTIPTSTFNDVAAGSDVVQPSAISGSALTAGAKPRILYIGAEFCPYCATERWPMTVALMRFGTFTGLGQTSSSATDVDPNTATLSYHGATYASSYLSFTGVETTTNQPDSTNSPPYRKLDTPSAADEAIFEKYNSGGSIPFVDIDNRYVVIGASSLTLPDALQGLTHDQIAADLSDPSTKIAKIGLGIANTLTAAICVATNQQPASVCATSGVEAAARMLPAQK